MLITVSKKDVDFVSKSNDAVNLMVGSNVLILARNSNQFAYICVNNLPLTYTPNRLD